MYEFVYDPTAGILAVIEEITPSGSVYYVREPEGLIIALIESGEVKCYHFDALGSTRLLTDGSGNVIDAYTYDAWGNVLHPVGSTQQPYQYVGELGYYAHYQDANLSLLQLGVRLYDPETGRFTQRDPAHAGPEDSPYRYADGMPTLLQDPSGLKSYWDYEKEFLKCVGDCTGITDIAKTVPALASTIGLCFKNGKWVGWAKCAQILCKATKALATAIVASKPAGIAAKCAALVAEAFALSCEAKCYLKLL